MKRLAALLLMALPAVPALAGNHESKPPADRMPQEGEGVVVVSLTANIPSVQQWDSLAITQVVEPAAAGQPAPKPERYTLSQVSRGMARDTSLFAGVVPAGTYLVTRIADDESTKFLDLSDHQQQLLGRFAVEAGSTSDLGRLVLTPVNDKVVLGRSESVADNAALLRDMSPDNQAALPARAGGGWLGARSGDDHAEALALIEPTGAHSPVLLADGLVAMPARIGSVMLRNPSGRWRSLRSGGLESLLCAVRGDLPEVVLYAAGEANGLFAIDGAGRFQRLDTGDLPVGTILFLGNGGEHGWWLVHERGASLTVYHSTQLDHGHWEAVRSEQTGFSFWSGQNKLWVLPTRAGLLLARSDQPLHFLDYATGAWTDRPLPEGGRIVDLLAGVPGSIGLLTGTKGGFAGVFSSSYYTRDDGATWKKFSPPKKIRGLPPLVLADATLVQQSIAMGFSVGKQVYQVSHDDGATWQTLEAKLPINSTLYPVEGVGLLGVAVWPQWNIEQLWVAKDAGSPWELEQSNWINPPGK